MNKGTIKFFNGRKGFGFIVPEDGGTEVYFCRSSLPRDRQYDPVEGDSVTYQQRKSDRGMMAVRMELL